MKSDSERFPMRVRPALLVFGSFVLFFSLINLAGYALYFADLPAGPRIIFLLVLFQAVILVLWLSRRPWTLTGDPFEFAGLVLVVAGTFTYFLFPSLPGLLAPSFSGDAANHLAYANTVYSTGGLFKDYPAGPALIIATLAHWVGWLPLRIMHPIGSLWMALTFGGVYGIACAMLPDQGLYKVVALFAGFALLVPWGYSGGMLIFANYFLTQVAAEFFLIAFVWFLVEYLQSNERIFLLGMALCLISISVSWQLWVGLPTILFVGIMLFDWLRGRITPNQVIRSSFLVLAPLAAFWSILLLTSRELMPTLDRLYLAHGAVIAPTLGALGGAFLLLPILGILLAIRQRTRMQVVAGFAILLVLQTMALGTAHFALGMATRWLSSSFYPWIFPLALFAVIPVAFVARALPLLLRRLLASWPGLGAVFCIMVIAALYLKYPPHIAPLSESDIEVAQWAKGHLDTVHINYIGTKNLTASWLGAGIWGEKYPPDLFMDMAALGPKTFEEWRDDPDWGEYLFVSSGQHLPSDDTLRLVYQKDDSMILEKPSVGSAVPITSLAGTEYGNVLGLADYTLASQAYRPGDVLSLTADIETHKTPEHAVVWRLQLRDLQNEPAAEARIAPFDNKFPLQRWPSGRAIPQELGLALPEDIRPGLYDLQLGLYDVGDGRALAARQADGTQDDVIHLSRVKIALAPISPNELESITRADLRFGDSFALVGYRLGASPSVHPGESVQLTLYWKSLAPTWEDYTVFVHLLDLSGSLRAQQDSQPCGGTYPTSIWAPGEIVPDPITLTLPADAAPGDYEFEVGLYQWPSLKRLPITRDTGGSEDDHVVLPVRVHVANK